MKEFLGINLKWLFIIILFSALVGWYSTKIEEPKNIQYKKELIKKLQKEYLQ